MTEQHDANGEAFEGASANAARTDEVPQNRFVAFGDDGEGIPLAAILRQRGRRRRGGEPAPGDGRSVADVIGRVREEGGRHLDEADDFDIVLTDAFHVDEAAQDDPVAAGRSEARRAPEPDLDHEPLGVPEPSLAGTATRELEGLLPEDTDPVWAHTRMLEEVERQSAERRTPTDGSWFAELFNREYNLGYPDRPAFARPAEIDFIEQSLDLVKGGRILDLACGDGRHAIPMSRRGYEVVGIDLSLSMLERGLGRIQPPELPVKLVHGDMRDLKFNEVFDGACLLGTSFGFFTDVENMGVLRGIQRALKRGGRVVIQVANRDNLVQSVPNRAWWSGDGCLIQEDIEFDMLSSRLKVRRYMVFGDGRERTHDIDVRLYSPHELRQMIELVGLKVEDVSGAVETRGAFFGACSPGIWITAAKA